uniref:Uncharacterized protein n=1 Tax=Arundo donax TaxID=35708 RepID=A0A0A8Y6X9_ARUDO
MSTYISGAWPWFSKAL